MFIERCGDDGSISPLSKDNPISRELNSLLSAPARPFGVKVPLRLGHGLTNLVSSELTTHRDALTNLFEKVVENKERPANDEELQKKYKEEIENLDRQIEETQK